MNKYAFAFLLASPALCFAQASQPPSPGQAPAQLRPGTGPQPVAAQAARPMPNGPSNPGQPSGYPQGTPPSPPTSVQPLPPAPAGAAAKSNPFARGAGTGGPAAPAAVPLPSVATAPTVAPVPLKKEDIVEEDVPSIRVGKVNGEYIYRGTNTYLFEETGLRKIVRKPVAVVVAGPAAGPSRAGAPPTPNLPSSVGRPAPATGRPGVAPQATGRPPSTAARPATTARPATSAASPTQGAKAPAAKKAP